MRRLKRDKSGISSVIVVMLGLVLVVIVVSNVVLWSYQMNQLDWERMQEKIILTNAEWHSRSSWFATQTEYSVNVGSRLTGSHVDTWIVDEQYESFREESGSTLDIAGDFCLDVLTYPLAYVQSAEIQIRYRTSDTLETWFLKAYNWTSGQYSDAGFNTTAGDTPTAQFQYYGVNLTDVWQGYIQNGIMKIQFHGNATDANQTIVDIDFLGIRLVLDGTTFSFENQGSMTSRIVGIWVTNATLHRRYYADFFLNSAARTDYFRPDITLPTSDFTVRVVTERGNTAVLRKD